MPEKPDFQPVAFTILRLVIGCLALVFCFIVLAILNLYVLSELLINRAASPAPTGPLTALLFAGSSLIVLTFIWIVTFRPDRSGAKFQFSLRTALAVTLTLSIWMTLNTRVSHVPGTEREIQALQTVWSESLPWNWTPESRILSVTHRYHGWPLQWDWLVYEIDKPADGTTPLLSIPPDPEDPGFYQLGNLFVCAAMLILVGNMGRIRRTVQPYISDLNL